jgi:hypothetical protein
LEKAKEKGKDKKKEMEKEKEKEKTKEKEKEMEMEKEKEKEKVKENKKEKEKEKEKEKKKKTCAPLKGDHHQPTFLPVQSCCFRVSGSSASPIPPRALQDASQTSLYFNLPHCRYFKQRIYQISAGMYKRRNVANNKCLSSYSAQYYRYSGEISSYY